MLFFLIHQQHKKNNNKQNHKNDVSATAGLTKKSSFSFSLFFFVSARIFLQAGGSTHQSLSVHIPSRRRRVIHRRPPFLRDLELLPTQLHSVLVVWFLFLLPLPLAQFRKPHLRSAPLECNRFEGETKRDTPLTGTVGGGVERSKLGDRCGV